MRPRFRSYRGHITCPLCEQGKRGEPKTPCPACGGSAHLDRAAVKELLVSSDWHPGPLDMYPGELAEVHACLHGAMAEFYERDAAADVERDADHRMRQRLTEPGILESVFDGMSVTFKRGDPK